MPQYKKVFDAGLYSSGGGFTRVGVPTLRSPGSGGKQVAKSLRFRAANTAYLNRTFAAGNRKTWTFSAWIKLGSVAANGYSIFGGGTPASSWGEIGYDGSSYVIYIRDYNGSSNDYQLSITLGYKDPSTWYHLVVKFDDTQAAQTDRLVVYLNNVAQTATGTYPAQNTDYRINNTGEHRIMRYMGGAANYLDGYLADVNFIGGSALTPSSFGEYNSDNIWVPKAYSGSYSGTNSFYLDFSDVATTSGSNAGFGKDTSGNGNYWTTNGLSATAGTTYDSMYDSPTDYDNGVYGAGNYCVLNPLSKDPTNGTLSNANLTITYATYSVNNAAGVRGTIGVNTGKWYWEHINITTAGAGNITSTGMTPYTGTLYGYSAQSGTIPTYIGALPSVYSNYVRFFTVGMSASLASGTTLFASCASGDVISTAIDFDAGKIWIGKNGTWYNSGNPAAGTNPTSTFTTPSTVCFPETEAVTSSTNGNQSISYMNFGQQPWDTRTSGLPTGFKALNTRNITRPTDANMWFYGDTPDLVWIKNRSATSNHSLTDTVRGVGLSLLSSATDAEKGDQDIAELNKFGMTVIGASSRTTATASANNFVYWAWKGGGAATTNTSGSITSQVSANVAAGFSVVTWTGNGALATIGHGLGPATPSMIITKIRSSTGGWPVYHVSIGATGAVQLESTGATSVTSAYWNNTTPTSTVFTVNSGINANAATFVAYCFAPVSGYSAFGSYTGNGSTDGPFVYTGFRPRWILVKRTDSTSDWYILDTSRDTYNVETSALFPNLALAEATGWLMDVLSNGFKLRLAGGFNTSSGAYIYAAFAENPFKISRAR